MKYLIIILLLFTSCRSSKRDVDKSVETQKIEIENAIKKNIEIKTDTYKTLESVNFSIEPLDAREDSYYIHGKDTFKFKNSKINFNKDKSTESDKSTNKSTEEDNSKLTLDTKKDDKTINRQTKSSSWGVNIAVILGILLSLYLTYKYITKT